jgi:hypothetical protein
LKLPGERAPSISGAGGELAVAYRYPNDPGGDLDPKAPRKTAVNRLNAAIPAAAMAGEALAAERARIGAVLDRLDRFQPKWSEVPFISGAHSGPSTATAVWDGDGIRSVSDLLDTTSGPLTEMVRPTAVRDALAECVAGAPPARRRPALLQQFAYLAVATRTLQPDPLRATPPPTYIKLTTPLKPVPAAIRAAKRRLRAVARRSRLVRRVWSARRRLN